MTSSLRYTSADLELLPDIEGVRYEIIDGDLYVSKTPRREHQYTCVVISSALHWWNVQTGNGVVYIAPGLIFAPDQDVIPDLVWFSRARLPYAIDDAGHFRAASDLVVEVLSPGSTNEHRDRDLKLRLYSRQGVQEYWIADWRLRMVEVYRRHEAALHLIATLQGEDSLTSPLLPGFSCPLTTLWEPALDAAV